MCASSLEQARVCFSFMVSDWAKSSGFREISERQPRICFYERRHLLRLATKADGLRRDQEAILQQEAQGPDWEDEVQVEKFKSRFISDSRSGTRVQCLRQF